MSISELKEQVVALTAEERLELAALIAHLNRRDDPAYHAEIDRRLAEMETGQKMSQGDLEKLHQQLVNEGR
jgi:hypothetical protein